MKMLYETCVSLSLSLSVCLWGAGLVTMATTSNGEADKGSVSLSLCVLSAAAPVQMLCVYLLFCGDDDLDLDLLGLVFSDGLCLRR